MTNEELIEKLKHLANNPDSVSPEKFIYIINLLENGLIQSFWDKKINYETLCKILYANEE